MAFATMGKILNVDLSTGETRAEAIPDEIYRKYLSGTGLAAWLLHERIPAGADPLGPDNILGFVAGLLTGTPSYFTGRWSVVGKSPLTGTWGDANCGGNLSPAIKRNGFDGIFFRGVSDKPSTLYVKTGRPNCATPLPSGGRTPPRPRRCFWPSTVPGPARPSSGLRASASRSSPGSSTTGAAWPPVRGWAP
jgi:hypothetical protein